MSITLDSLLEPIAHLFAAGVEEIIINKPGEAWIWMSGAFHPEPIKLDADDIIDIAIVAGAQRRQEIGPDSPLLATDLPGVGRLQAVLPPCVSAGKPALVIRRGDDFSPMLDDLSEAGLFASTQKKRADGRDDALHALYENEEWKWLLDAAVLSKKTILICGETASGKTSVAKALINAIPHHERIITIEDTPEWTHLPHMNQVNLFYDKNGSGIGPRDLVEAALRMRIGRLLLQELRDGVAAAAFLRALATGHPGGITTIHARSCDDAFHAVATMLKETGSTRTEAEVHDMLRRSIDVVVHCQRDGQAFSVDEVKLTDAD